MFTTFLFLLINEFKSLLKFLSRLLYGSHTKVREIQLFYFLPNGFLIKGNHMSIIARIDQKVTFKPVFKDAAGNAVEELGSVPAWSLSDNSLATIEVLDGGFTAIVSPNGHIGHLEVNLVVDADPEEALEEIVAKATIDFKAGKAAFISLGGVVSDFVQATTQPPVVETTQPPVVEVTTQPPVVDVTTQAPVVDVTTQAPMEQTTTSAPVEQPVIEQPATEDPVVDTTTQQPVEQTTAAPVDQVTTEAPVDTATQQPVDQTTTAAPVDQVATDAPVVDQTTTAAPTQG